MGRAWLLLALVAVVACGHPSDDALVRYFREHQATFERLRVMITSESETPFVTKDFAQMKLNELARSGVVNEAERTKWTEYLRLLEALDLEDDAVVRGGPPKPNVTFRLSATGQLLRGSIKTLVYCEGEPGTLFDSLDDVGRVRERCKVRGCAGAYRRVQGNWYLELEL